MFGPLRLFLAAIWVSSVAGAVVIAGLALGYYGLWTFIWAGIVGLLVGLPAAMLNWAYLRPRRAREEGWR